MDESVESLVEKTKKEKRCRLVLGSLAMLVMIGFVIGSTVVIVLFYVTEDDNASGKNNETPAKNIYSGVELLSYLSKNDGLNVHFSKDSQSIDKLTETLEGDCDVVEVELVDYLGEACTKGDHVQFDQWLNTYFLDTTNTKPLKINVLSENVLDTVVSLLRECNENIKQPVMLGCTENADLQFTINTIESIFPNVTLVIELPEFEKSWDFTDEIARMLKNTSINVMFGINVENFVDNYQFGKLLYLQDFKIGYTVYINKPTSNLPVDRFFQFRDNLNYNEIFYSDFEEMNKPMLEIEASGVKRTKNFYSGGDALTYYRMNNAMDIMWSHRTNSREELEANLNDANIKFIEADIKLYNGTAVMNHDPPVSRYDLTLEEWLEMATDCTTSSCPKGLKLDYKSIEAVENGMKIVAEFASKYKFPIWVNADVVRGPNSQLSRPVDPERFIQSINENYPFVTMSPGWKTAYNPASDSNYYTDDMMQEMYSHVSGHHQAVTFPARASLTHSSIEQFKWLLSKSNRYTLTIWHSTSEQVSTEQLLKIYNSFDASKVYYDIPQSMMDDLIEAVYEQERIKSPVQTV